MLTPIKIVKNRVKNPVTNQRGGRHCLKVMKPKDMRDVDGRMLTKRWPADDRRIYCRPPATDRHPGSQRWGACRSSSGHWGGHRPEILSFAERIGRWPNSLPATAGRRPLHDFYDMVQGRENPLMTCRCQKVGIGEKSAGHRSIYKACDVGLKRPDIFCHDPKVI